jgi:Ca-activated chloride channel homolog
VGVSVLGDFHFLHPAWLLALPALVLVAASSFRRRGRRDGAWARVVDGDLLPLVRMGGAGMGRSPWIVVCLAWAVAVLALAGPTWQRRESAGYRAPAAWVLLLDLSPSMRASDVLPNRVTRARYAIEDLLSAARDARVALVVFAGDPYTVTPLTTDVATIRTLLAPLAPQLMPESGHRLAPALADAERLLQRGNAGHGEVIVLTDGLDDEAQALGAAARLRQEGATVQIVGVGTASGAPERDDTGEFVRNENGDIVVSHVESAALADVAAAGGGRYVALAGIPSLIATLDTERSRAVDTGALQDPAGVASWRNDGVWLLPALLALTALVARKGWI